MQQMQQLRVGRASQVPVPPVSAAPLQISREMRQQLRVTRHRAFERHQENAQWTKKLLDGPTAQDGAFVTASGCEASPEELQKQVEAKKKAAQELERQLTQQKEAQEVAQRRFVTAFLVLVTFYLLVGCNCCCCWFCCRFDEMLTILKAAEDAAAVKQCEEKVAVEKMLLLTCKPRKIEIVRL